MYGGRVNSSVFFYVHVAEDSLLPSRATVKYELAYRSQYLR